MAARNKKAAQPDAQQESKQQESDTRNAPTAEDAPGSIADI